MAKNMAYLENRYGKTKKTKDMAKQIRKYRMSRKQIWQNKKDERNGKSRKRNCK